MTVLDAIAAFCFFVGGLIIWFILDHKGIFALWKQREKEERDWLAKNAGLLSQKSEGR